MSKYELIIFDWDGTLMDSASKIVACMQGAAKLAQMPIPTEEQVKHIIGISLVPAIQQLFALDDIKVAEHIAKLYKQVFVETDQVNSPLFAGAHALLTNLQNNSVLMAVATGKARRGLERAWQQTNTKGYFHTSRCADEAESKPSSDMLWQILDELALAPAQALMVGDTSYDMQMAADIGMDRIAMSHGAHQAHKLEPHQPLEILDDLAELQNYLL